MTVQRERLINRKIHLTDEMIRKAVCWAVIGLFAAGFFAGLGSAEKAEPVVQNEASSPSLNGYVTHAPIRINSDDEFNASFSNRTIWGLEINGTGYGCCIFIGNCSISFTVKCCYLHHAGGRNVEYFQSTGLFIYQSSNGILLNNHCIKNDERGIYLFHANGITITDNNCSENWRGIYLWSSTSNIINYNSCIGNRNRDIDIYISNNNLLKYNICSAKTSNINDYYGIVLEYSDNNSVIENNCSRRMYGIYLGGATNSTVSGNYCKENSYGIYLRISNFNTISSNYDFGDYYGWGGFCLDLSMNDIFRQNKMYGRGFGFIEGALRYYNTHIIDNTNLVNGKPVYFLKNQTGNTIPSGAGQVILVNCSCIKVQNQTLTNLCFGILEAYSNHCTLINNRFSGWIRNIMLRFSSNNLIANNIGLLFNCSISLDSFCNNNTIVNNTFAIYLITCYGNTIAYNTAYYQNISSGGISIYNSSGNIIIHNNVSFNGDIGILLVKSWDNTVAYNNISYNKKYGIGVYDTSSSYNHIYHNNLISNNGSNSYYNKSHIQAYDGGINFWNSSYPSGGNYWSDWTAPDVKSGPNQDISGSDGIVDSPYLIDGGAGAKDYYPLTTPPPVPESPPPALALVLLIILPIVVTVRRRK